MLANVPVRVRETANDGQSDKLVTPLFKPPFQSLSESMRVDDVDNDAYKSIAEKCRLCTDH